MIKNPFQQLMKKEKTSEENDPNKDGYFLKE